MRFKRLTACILAGAIMCSAALTGCGSAINQSAVGATLDGKEISMGFMNFMARYQQAYFDQMYMAYFGADMWSSDTGTEGTMEETTKNNVLESIEELYLLDAHSSEYGGTELTEEEQAAITEAAAQFLSTNSDKAIRQVGATQEYVEEMLRLYTVRQKVVDGIYAEVDTEVSDEEAAQKTISYIRVSLSNDAPTGLSEEEKDEIKTKFEAAVTEAQKDFDSATEEYGETYFCGTASYGKDDTALEDAVKEAADKLKEGEVSELITTDSYFYVVRLDSEFDDTATENKKQSIISTRRNEHYTEVLDGYKAEASWEVNESEWGKAKFDRIFGAPAAEEE